MRTIARWESTTYEYRPDERYQLLLAHVFAVRHGRTAIGPGSDFDHLLLALQTLGVSVERLDALRALAHSLDDQVEGALLASPAPGLEDRLGGALQDPGRVDAGLLRHLDRVVTELATTEPPVSFARRHSALAPMVEVMSRLLLGSQPAALRRQLDALASRCFALAGRVAFELYDDHGAELLYERAFRAAAELHDGRAEASARASSSMVILYVTGDPGRGLARAEQAAHRAGQGSSRKVRARALAICAEMHARRGDARQALRALRQSATNLNGSEAGDGAFDDRALAGFAGVCDLQLRHLDQATTDLIACLNAEGSPHNAVQRGMRGDPEAGCDALHKCIDLVAQTRGRVAAQRVSTVRRALEPWRGRRPSPRSTSTSSVRCSAEASPRTGSGGYFRQCVRGGSDGPETAEDHVDRKVSNRRGGTARRPSPGQDRGKPRGAARRRGAGCRPCPVQRSNRATPPPSTSRP